MLDDDIDSSCDSVVVTYGSNLSTGQVPTSSITITKNRGNSRSVDVNIGIKIIFSIVI